MRVQRVPADNEFAASRSGVAYADADRLIGNEPFLVLPFHRMIVPPMLAQAART